MSTDIQQSQQEEKQFDRSSGKDDQKQQHALRKKESADSVDIPADGGSSLVGGTINALQSGVDKALHMLPTSVQTKIGEGASTLSLAAQPVTQAYNNDGLLAAAKVAGGIGTSAAASAGSTLKSKLTGSTSTSGGGGASGLFDADAASKRKGRRRRGGRGHGHRGLKTRALPEREQESIRDTLGDKASELKDVVVEDVHAAEAASAGLMGSIKSTASGIVGSAKSTASGLVDSVQSSASGLVGSVQSTASGIVDSVSSTASGLVSGVKGAAAAGVQGAKDTISGVTGTTKSSTRGSKALPPKGASLKQKAALKGAQLQSGAEQAASSIKSAVASGLESAKEGVESAKASLQRKPSLERRNELPALGTPMTPDDKAVRSFDTAPPTDSEPGVSVAPASSIPGSGLVASAKFYSEKIVDAVKDKLDNLSMNADDESEMSANDKALAGANKQLKGMKESLATDAKQSPTEGDKEIKQFDKASESSKV